MQARDILAALIAFPTVSRDSNLSLVHEGVIAGGTASDFAAGDCRFGLDFRGVPGEIPTEREACTGDRIVEIEEGMKAIAPRSGIDAVTRFTVTALVREDDGPEGRLARALTVDHASHVVSHGTEAGQVWSRGCSVVVCWQGDIAEAHRANEFLQVAQCEADRRFMEDVLR